MSCKGVCDRHKAQKPVGVGRYAAGQRRCQICEVFLKWEGLWCPCCNYRLRTRPRNLKYKTKLQETNVRVGSTIMGYMKSKNGRYIRGKIVELVKHVSTENESQVWMVKTKGNQECEKRFILPDKLHNER